MRICRVSLSFPTVTNNGIGLHPYHTSNLIKAPTLVLTRQISGQYLKEESHVDLQPIKFIQIPFPKDRKSNPLQFILALLAYACGQVEFFLKAVPKLIKFKPSIIHLQSPHAILVGIFAKYVLGAKLAITFHGSDLRRIETNKPFLRLLRIADRIFYVAASMEELLSKHFSKEQLLHTPSGIDLDFFLDFQPTTRENVILAVGNLRWQKDYPTLLRALEIVFKRFNEFNAVIIGSGPDEASLKQLAAELKIENHVFFLGQQPAEVVREKLYSAKVFVMSSVSEGMPKAVIEAMVTSTPVVSTAVGAIPEILDSRGLVSEPQNPSALATAIISALSGGISSEMIDRSKELALNYSWSELANLLEREFKVLLRETKESSK